MEKCWQDWDRSKKLEHLFTTEFMIDCKFVVGPDSETTETFVGHKLMFILESPVLEKALTGKFEEANNNEIRIKDVQPKDFKNFRYMIYNNRYSNICKFSLEEIFQLYRICDKYMVSSISNNCMYHLRNILSSPSIQKLIKIFEFASNLLDKSLLRDTEKVIISGKVPLIHDSLNDLPEESFYKYMLLISKLQNKPSAINMFAAVNSYFVQNCLLETKTSVDMAIDKDITKDGRGEFKRKLIELIDFMRMTTVEFINGPGKSELLDKEEKFEILSSLCKK